MADNDDMQTEDLGQAISSTEATNRTRSGGFLANGQPAPQKAMVDTQNASTPAPEHQRSLMEVDAGITGAASAKPLPNKPLLQPHQFDMTNWSDEQKLQAAARAGGIDTDKVPPEYWGYLVKKYAAANDPNTLQVAQHWIQATGVGHLMAGWDEGGPTDTIPLSTMEKTNPRMAEMRKADQFFNQNIQSRIIEKGQYISPDGNNYVPPESYKIGRILGSVMANPGSAAGIPGAAKVALTGAMSVGAKALQTVNALAAQYPRAADLVTGLAKWGGVAAIGKAMFGRGAELP